jgi:hypothetical protein
LKLIKGHIFKIIYLKNNHFLTKYFGQETIARVYTLNRSKKVTGSDQFHAPAFKLK